MRSPLTTKLLAVLLPISALVSWSPVASAQLSDGETAVISIAGARVPRGWADEVARDLIAQLDGSDFITPAEARARLERDGGTRALAQAAAGAAAARQALDTFEDLEETADQLRAAAEAHLEILPLLGTLDEPLRLLLGLATVELALGHDGQVAEALETAARLDPLLDLDPLEVSPQLVRAARAARRAVAGTPLLAPAAARALADRLGLSQMLIVQPRPDQSHTAVDLYQASSGRPQQSWLVETADLDQVAEELSPSTGARRPDDGAVEVVDQEDPELSPRTFSNTRPEGDDPPRAAAPWYRRWWFWTLIGALVAGGAAVGVVLGLRANAPPSDLPLEVHSHW